MTVPAGTGATGAAGAAAAIAQAIKASGAIVRLEPEQFLNVLARAEAPVVVVAETPRILFFKASYQYLTSYKGLFFYTKHPATDGLLALGEGVEVIPAKSIWVPA
jgi:hypothetical protein